MNLAGRLEQKTHYDPNRARASSELALSLGGAAGGAVESRSQHLIFDFLSGMILGLGFSQSQFVHTNPQKAPHGTAKASTKEK